MASLPEATAASLPGATVAKQTGTNWRNTFGLALVSGAMLIPSLSASQPVTVSEQQMIDNANAELRNTDVLVVLERGASGDPIWGVTVDGTVADQAVDYEGSSTVLNAGGPDEHIEYTPPLPVLDDSRADLLPAALLAIEQEVLSGRPDVHRVSLEIGAPLSATDDPARFLGAGIDPQAVIKRVKKSALPRLRDPQLDILLSPTASAALLVDHYGLAPADASAFVKGTLDLDDTTQAFRCAAVQSLAQHGISAPAASDVFDLRLAIDDDQAFYLAAIEALIDAGEPVAPILAAGQAASDPTHPLSATNDPGDIEIEITLEGEVEVSIPPFVTITVKASVTVRGPLSDDAALLAEAQAARKVALDVAEAEARRKLEDLPQ
jgi:hypothetical protein